MTTSIPIIALLIALEATFLFISLRAIIQEGLSAKRSAFLFLGIIVANLASGILAGSVFRFLLIAILLYGLLKMLARRDAHFYHLFLIMVACGIKVTLEVAYVAHILGAEIFTPVHALFGGIGILIFPVLLYKPTQRLNNNMQAKWRALEISFYKRYAIILIATAGVMLYLYAMIWVANALPWEV